MEQFDIILDLSISNNVRKSIKNYNPDYLIENYFQNNNNNLKADIRTTEKKMFRN